MTKISNEEVYIIDNEISDLDSLIGTDVNTLAKKTKNFLLGKMKQYFVSGLSPLTGGTLRFSEIIYNGELYSTPEDVLNSLDPAFTVEQYHVVVVSVNGVKSILKLQNIVVGVDLEPLISDNFINIPVSVGPTGATGATGANGTNGTNGTNGNGIASVALLSTVGLVKTYRITYTNSSVFDFTVTDGANGTNGTNGTNGVDYTSNNFQKILTLVDFTASNYTITQADNNYVLIIQNEATPVTITIPSGLSNAHFVGYTQEGTADVSFITSGTTLKNPIGFKIQGEDFQVATEQNGTTNTFHLHGNTKA